MKAPRAGILLTILCGMALPCCVPVSGVRATTETVRSSEWQAGPSEAGRITLHDKRTAECIAWYEALPLADRAAACRARKMTVEIDATGEEGLCHFTIASEMPADPLEHTHLRPGIGVPVIGWRANDGSGRLDRHRPPEGIFATLTAVSEETSDGSTRLRLLSPLRNKNVTLEGREIPLAANFTAPVAAIATRAVDLRESGRSGMLDSAHSKRREKLYLIQPYDPDKIPLLMVHGLQSTPVAFANLVNDLIADPEIAARYQIWHYHYPTGAPVLLNAANFRRVMRDTLREIDPEGDDFATNHIVAMGHSMGGILVHSMVCDSGYKLWDSVIHVRPEALELPEAEKSGVRDAFVFRRDPRIRRAIFIAVPHRGSTYADNWIGNIGQGLFRQDKAVVQGFITLLRDYRDQLDPFLANQLLAGKLSSIRTLSKKSPALRALAEIPPAVPFHTIVGQKSPAALFGKSDGVVAHDSSYLAGAESDLVVPSGHNAFRVPAAVTEIKRILKDHVDR